MYMFYIVVYTIVFFIWIMNKWITWTWLFFLTTTIKVHILADCSKQNHGGWAHFGSELFDNIYINSIIQFGPKRGFIPVDSIILLWPGYAQINLVTLTIKHVCTETNLSMKSAVLVNASSVRDRSIFIGELGPVQNIVGHKLFYDEKLIGPKLFSIPSLIGQQLF